MGASASPFIGRKYESGVVERLVARCRAGTGGWVLVEGEPGIGKTRLVEEMAATAHRCGVRVHAATATALDERPFGVIVDALDVTRDASDADRAEIAELLYRPAAASAPLTDLRFQLVERLCDLVENLATAGPLCVVLEDLHWADSSSLVCLHRLARRIRWIPVLLAVSYRPLPRGSELADLIAGSASVGAERIALGPLADDEVTELAQARVGAVVGERLRARLEAAGGNPLFVGELAAAWCEEGSVEVRSGVAELSEVVAPAPSLRLTVLARMSFLSEETLNVLRAASVLGSAFSLDELRTATGQPALELARLLGPAIDSGFLGSAGDRLAFRHDVVREALYLEMPAAVRLGLHRDLAGRLATAGCEARVVATHMALGATPGDAEAVDWLVRAGRERVAQAPSAAVELFETAADLLAPADPARDDVLLEMVQPLAMSKVDQAASLLRELLSRSASPERTRFLQQVFAGLLVYEGRLSELAALAEAELATPGLPEDDRAQMLLYSAMGLIASGQGQRGLQRAEQARDYVADHPMSLAGLMDAFIRAAFAAFNGRYDTAHAYVAAGRMAAQQGPQRQSVVSRLGVGLQRVQAQLYSSALSIFSDEFDRAETDLERARGELEDMGAVSLMSMYHTLRAYQLFLGGRHDDALAETTAARLFVEETGGKLVAPLFPDPSPLIHVHRGQPRAARRAIADIDQAGDSEPGLYLHWIGVTRAIVLGANGDPNGALDLLGEWRSALLDLGMFPDYRDGVCDVLRLALEHDRGGVVAAVVDDTAEAARRSQLASVQGAALLSRGIVEDDPDMLVQAVTTLQHSPRPLLVASACEEAGLRLLSSRQGEAAEFLDEARRTYEGLGAARDEARLRSALRRRGVRSGARGRRRRPSSGWDSLTPSETAVVDLVVDGLSNPEIAGRLYISRRTVTAHLSSVFRKLDVSSRAELAALAARKLI